MMAHTTRPVRNLIAAIGACTALTLALGGPTALADDHPADAPVDTVHRHFLPVVEGLYKPPLGVHDPFLLGVRPGMPVVAPADREPDEMPTLLPPAYAPAGSPGLTLPVVPGT